MAAAENAYFIGDYPRALTLFRILAGQGDLAAQTSLGFMYAEGAGVAGDFSEALMWFEMAADQGDVEGQYSVARAYDLGQGTGQDASSAAQWYTPWQRSKATPRHRPPWRSFTAPGAGSAKTTPKLMPGPPSRGARDRGGGRDPRRRCGTALGASPGSSLYPRPTILAGLRGAVPALNCASRSATWISALKPAYC